MCPAKGWQIKMKETVIEKHLKFTSLEWGFRITKIDEMLVTKSSDFLSGF